MFVVYKIDVVHLVMFGLVLLFELYLTENEDENDVDEYVQLNDNLFSNVEYEKKMLILAEIDVVEIKLVDSKMK